MISPATRYTLASSLIAFAALGLALTIQAARLKNVQADLRMEVAAHTQTRADRDVLRQTVSAWKAEADRRARIAQEARSQAAQYRASLKNRETRLREYIATGDECHDLRQILALHRAADPGRLPDPAP